MQIDGLNRKGGVLSGSLVSDLSLSCVLWCVWCCSAWNDNGFDSIIHDKHRYHDHTPHQGSSPILH